jgi:hypothetical protein
MDGSTPTPRHWSGAPLTRPSCPQHGTAEKARVVERQGLRFIEFACPVEGCPHTWIVKKIRL